MMGNGTSSILVGVQGILARGQRPIQSSSIRSFSVRRSKILENPIFHRIEIHNSLTPLDLGPSSSVFRKALLYLVTLPACTSRYNKPRLRSKLSLVDARTFTFN